MTGLDLTTDVIIEIATIVTDAELNILAEGPALAIHQSDLILTNMNDWCIAQHGRSGLIERVRHSRISCVEAEQQTVDFLRDYLDAGISPMCGNSIGNDRRFIDRDMPELAAFFHYRNIDVSTLKELARRWQPQLLTEFHKSNTHLALHDVRESIQEMRYYREHFIRHPVQPID